MITGLIEYRECNFELTRKTDKKNSNFNSICEICCCLMISYYPDKLELSQTVLLICDSFIEWVYVLPVLSNPPEQGWSPVGVERLSDFLAGRVVLFVRVETLAAAIAVTAVLQSLKKK